MSGTDQFAIWWLSQDDYVVAIGLGAYGAAWPAYIQEEFRSREGRAGRGRLWVADETGFAGGVEDLAALRELDRWAAAGIDVGGIVVRRCDAHHVAGWPGFLTDMALRPIDWRMTGGE